MFGMPWLAGCPWCAYGVSYGVSYGVPRVPAVFGELGRSSDVCGCSGTGGDTQGSSRAQHTPSAPSPLCKHAE